jgi:outer membrane protein TolC
MNKLKIFAVSMAVVVSVGVGNNVLAEGNSLNIDDSINTAISSSYEVKNIDISISKAQASYDTDMKNTDTYGKQLNQAGLDQYSKLTIMQKISDSPKQDKFDEYKYTQIKTVAENKIKLSAYTQYIDVMNDRDSLKLESQKFENTSEKYNSDQLKFKNGSISEADLQKSEAEFMAEKDQLNQIQRQYDMDIMSMNKVLGSDLYKTYDTMPIDKITETPYARTYEDYLNEAFENRAEILIENANIELQKAKYNTVNGVFPEKQSVANRLASANLENSKDDLEIQKLNITSEINSLYNDLQIKAKALGAKKDAYNLSRTNYDIAKVKYNVGVLSKIDFDATAVDLQEKQNDLKSAQRNIWMAEYKLVLASEAGSDTSRFQTAS